MISPHLIQTFLFFTIDVRNSFSQKLTLTTNLYFLFTLPFQATEFYCRCPRVVVAGVTVAGHAEVGDCRFGDALWARCQVFAVPGLALAVGDHSLQGQ